MLSRLNVRVRTPSPLPSLGVALPQTPRNATELHDHSTKLRDRIRRHQNSSPTAIIESVDRLARGAAIISYQGTLISNEAANLRRIAEVATGRKSRKRQFIQKGGALTIEEGSQLAAEGVDSVQDVEGGALKRLRANRTGTGLRHCSRCHEVGHDTQTCPKDGLATEAPEQELLLL